MKIKIMEIYKEGFHSIRTHKREWLKVATGPVLVWAIGLFILISAMISTRYYFGVFTLLPSHLHIHEGSSNTFFFNFAYVIYHILFFIAIINLEINGYRYAIVEEKGKGLITVAVNRRFFRFIIYMIIFQTLIGIYITAIAGIVAGVNSFLERGEIGVLLASFLILWGIYINYRVTLFPLIIAVDQHQPFKTSWKLVKGNVLRLIGLSIVVTFMILLIGILSGLVMALIWFLAAVLFGLLGDLLGITEGIILGFRVTLGVIMVVLWILFLVLFAWALNSKVMGLIYQRLSDQDATENKN